MESRTSDIFKLWRSSLFSKCSKVHVDFGNAIKLAEHIDCFDDNCVWACSVIFCELSQQYMWSAFDVVKSVPKLSQPTKRHNTQLNLFDINGKLP